MAGSHLFRMGTVKGKNGVLIALKHNKRTLQAERGAGVNIDPSRETPLNYSLTEPGSAEAIDRHAKVLMVQADIDRPRINQVSGNGWGDYFQFAHRPAPARHPAILCALL